MKPELSKIIEALITVGRPAILEEAGLTSCILATKITIETLDHYGYKAQPVGVDAIVANKIQYEAVRAGLNPREVEGAWGVGIGFRKDGEECGHCVAVVEDTLIDLSIDQASRPEHNMPIYPLSVWIPPTFWDGVPTRYENIEDGVELQYLLANDERWWERSPNWSRRDASRRARVVGRVIRSLRTTAAHADQPV